MIDKIFNVIEIKADNKHYYPNSMKKESWMEDNYVPENEINIPLGQSRYGGCVIDLPKDFEIPKNMRFAGQLDLNEVGKFDKTNLLPKTGQLFFFADIKENIGKVIYKDIDNTQLQRVINEHEDHFFLGVLIKGFKPKQEKLSDYYKVPEEDLECWECGGNITKCKCEFEYKKDHIKGLDLNEDGKNWGCFEGYGTSKIFGVYANCQTFSRERLKIMEKQIVLLQIGENGFNDEGVFNVLIKEEDLKKLNFDDCTLEWVQS
ncbi:DUF1963 domain-containing protein [uncultured Polaribacter sp.]|uniref:DUF1963 domain-containing protein n=1 Tax=uncultured Polaribacter sp. TaxID=174711 RepID=UPI002610B60D|nr:DUF1963 domain-containing protein [uncultured Polaribacter sp.]